MKIQIYLQTMLECVHFLNLIQVMFMDGDDLKQLSVPQRYDEPIYSRFETWNREATSDLHPMFFFQEIIKQH